MMRSYPRWAGSAAVRPPAITVEMLYAVFCVFALWMSLAVPRLRHLTYLIPMCGVIACLAVRKFVVPVHLLPYWLLIGVGIMLIPLSGRNGYQDIYLFLVGVMPFVLGYEYRFKWWTAFWVMVAGLVTSVVMLRLMGGGGGEFQIDVAGSRSSFESPWCFAFGALTVWAIATRRWKETAVGILFTLLTLKRIALLGVLLCLVVSLLPRRFTSAMLRPIPMLLFNLAALSLAVTYAQGGFDELIHNTMGMSANQAGMGRKELYLAPSVELTSHIERYVWIGSGAGAAYDFLSVGFFHGQKLNLHHDVMKIVLEYGGLTLCGFIWLAFRLKSITMRLFWLYANVLLVTDNTLIYAYFTFCIGMMAMAADAEVKEQAAVPVPGPSRWQPRPPGFRGLP
ncbi:hypothetical protein OOT46_05485 [Aquabacterium sp. A7-Y]|uniref:hypothetical protein n=1 Tax=Aquabacterium sp. A7-Y TaxID=1349605 RepID=UPI00223CEE9E|nr:hypothetical protein [Aquabacterium sp. A7-Y]MCW7537303.1 hypothetical protein [Aquabacterium sp. A7-Y]